jgi:hypothetical protein
VITLPRRFLPLTALQLTRLCLALPVGVRLTIVDIDWEAGTFRYIER